LFIIKQRIWFKVIFFIFFAALLFIKIIILYITFNVIVAQVLIVLFRAITCISSNYFRHLFILVLINFCMFLQCGGVGCCLMQLVIYYVLVVGGYLKIISGL